MPIATLTCHRLDCDGCGKPIIGEDVEGYEYAPHYDTPQQALEHLYGDPDVERDNPDGRFLLPGQQLPDGQTLCGKCNTKRLCVERGHRWREWSHCWCLECDPWIHHHQQRSCGRRHCEAHERRPIASTASL